MKQPSQSKRIVALEKEKLEKKLRRDNLRQWLADHISDPSFEKVLSDLRVVEQQICNLNYQIDQLTHGRPTHGEHLGVQRSYQNNSRINY